MTVNISGQVPGEQQNGLVDIEPVLLHERTPEPIVAVVIIERASLKYNDVKQEWSAVVRFRHIEPLIEGEAAQARELLERGYATRTGATSMPTELDIDETPEPSNVKSLFEPTLPSDG